jgi:putative ABC transport system permease protein
VLFADSLKRRELDALSKKSNVPDAADIAPEVFVSGTVVYEGKTFGATILGFSAEFMYRNLGLKIAEGVLFDSTDINSSARVAVLGSRAKSELFGSGVAVGKYISIKGQKFRVVAVTAPKGTVSLIPVDDLVVVPYTTAQFYLTGTKHFNQILMRASTPEQVNRMTADIERTLRDLHKIEDPADDDFHIHTQQGILDQVSTIINVFTMFLSFVVAIALLVGGIGVMNIMLVSVTERTREIGLRKALGATDRDILTQFLIEAVMLSGIGGLIGVLLGTVLSIIASVTVRVFFDFGWLFSFPWTGAILGVLASALVGIIFGIYPARKASQKSPIEALRYE